jgi:hypothetical protein
MPQIESRKPVQRKGTNKSEIRFRAAAHYRGLVRALQVLDTFDCLQLAVILGVNYGTVSSMLAPIANEGYIEVTHTRGVYSRAELKRNPDLLELKLNYGSGNTKKSITFRKTKKWSAFMTRWHAFCKGATNRERRLAQAEKEFVDARPASL